MSTPNETGRGGKFTPGPWRRGQEGNPRIYGPDGQGEHSGLIAEVYKDVTANAKLIAAAPELWELKNKVTYFIEMAEKLNMGCIESESFQRMKEAAIQLATE